MSALGETQARIASIRKLRTVVGAMRGIAAAHLQQARTALKGFRAYAEVIGGGLGRAVELLEPPPAASPAPDHAAVVVFAAEHGLAGAFSERALDALGGAPPAGLFLLGARGVSLAEQRGWRADWSAPMASQAAGVGVTARRLADALYADFVEQRIARAEMVFARTSDGGVTQIVRQPLLPLDLTRFRTGAPGPPPLTNLPPGRLVERLVGEYVYAELALATLESFASENAARLATMESARLNIEEKLEALTGQERLQRQEEITAEVQEITFGALAAGAAGV